jgi:hypothetical protein
MGRKFHRQEDPWAHHADNSSGAKHRTRSIGIRPRSPEAEVRVRISLSVHAKSQNHWHAHALKCRRPATLPRIVSDHIMLQEDFGPHGFLPPGRTREAQAFIRAEGARTQRPATSFAVSVFPSCRFRNLHSCVSMV